MRRHIENMRRQPKEVRAHLAFVAAGVCTSLVFAAWAFGLSGRMSLESSDPVVAEYERELASQETSVSQPDTGVGSMLDNMRRGAAAIIFSQDEESEELVEENDNSLDIEALISAPVIEHESKPNDVIVVPPGDGGQVILIGTSSTNTADFNQ